MRRDRGGRKEFSLRSFSTLQHHRFGKGKLGTVFLLPFDGRASQKPRELQSTTQSHSIKTGASSSCHSCSKPGSEGFLGRQGAQLGVCPGNRSVGGVPQLRVRRPNDSGSMGGRGLRRRIACLPLSRKGLSFRGGRRVVVPPTDIHLVGEVQDLEREHLPEI